MAESSSETTEASRGAGWVALVLATSAVAGSLWLSMGMSLKACPLCLYQRSFVMCALAVLVVGVLLGAVESALACVLALPAAVAGTAVAAFHVYLEWIGKLECPAGLFALGTAPKQSLAVLVLLSGLLLFGSSTKKAPVATLGRALGAVVLGVLLAVGAVASAPPMPGPPAKPYDQPLDVCRPPFRGT